jgi:nucleoside phosphorylase
VADEKIVDQIQQYKKSLLAIDMEAFGVAKAAMDSPSGPVNFLIVKGVQDFADADKSDEYRDYCAFVSAGFLRLFLV